MKRQINAHKKIRSRSISLILTLVLLAAMVPSVAVTMSAANPTYGTSGDWAYVDNGSTITIVRYDGPGGAVTIPGTINGKPVADID